MATYFLDLENGNDANAGTSFATRKKTVSSIAGIAGISGSDDLRIMASNNITTSSTNSTWFTKRKTATNTISITGFNTTTKVVTVSDTSLINLQEGDSITISGITAGVVSLNGIWTATSVTTTSFVVSGTGSSNISGTWSTGGIIYNKQANKVVLENPLTSNITPLDKSVWTVVTNVTTASSIPYGHYSDLINISATFTTGKAAYKSTVNTDYSAYQQISFQWRQASGTLATAGQIQIKLCSDTLGATPVNTFNIPASPNLTDWQTVTIDNGAPLGNNIQSIAIYVTSDLANQSFNISNIIACKAPSSNDCLTLDTLIGPNDGTDRVFPIATIDNNTIYLASSPYASFSSYIGIVSSAVGGFGGTAGTYGTKLLNPIKVSSASSTTALPFHLLPVGLTISGGWNRSDMSTQTGVSLIQNSIGQATTTTSYGMTYNDGQNISKIGVSKFVYSIYNTTLYTTGVTFNLYLIYGYFTPVFASTSNLNVSIREMYGYTSGQDMAGDGVGIYENINYITGCNGLFLRNAGSSILIKNIDAMYASAINHNNATLEIWNIGEIKQAIYAITTGSNINIRNFNTISDNEYVLNLSAPGESNISNGTIASDNSNLVLSANSQTGHIVNFKNVVDNTTNIQDFPADFSNVKINYTNCSGRLTNGFITAGGSVTTDNSTRHTTSGISWKLSPTSSQRNSLYPLRLSLGEFYLTANNQVTFKAWMLRDNVGLTLELICPKFQISGVSTDVISTVTASENTWTEQTITFTPTQSGVVEIFAQAYGGTTYNGYVDDITITQV